MKTFVFLLIISFSFSSFTQHSTGIYKMTWRIDKRLTTAFQMETQNQGIIQDVNSFRMPDHHRDVVIEQTISIVNELLNTNSLLVYRKRKNGNQIATYASQEYVGGLPRSTKKKAIKEFEQDLYAKVYINVGSYKSNSFGLLGNGLYKFRPFVKVKIKAYSSDRKCEFRKKIKLTDFDKLNSVSYNLGGTTITNSQTLNDYEIKEMVTRTLNAMKLDQ